MLFSFSSAASASVCIIPFRDEAKLSLDVSGPPSSWWWCWCHFSLSLSGDLLWYEWRTTMLLYTRKEERKRERKELFDCPLFLSRKEKNQILLLSGPNWAEMLGLKTNWLWLLKGNGNLKPLTAKGIHAAVAEAVAIAIVAALSLIHILTLPTNREV